MTLVDSLMEKVGGGIDNCVFLFKHAVLSLMVTFS